MKWVLEIKDGVNELSSTSFQNPFKLGAVIDRQYKCYCSNNENSNVGNYGIKRMVRCKTTLPDVMNFGGWNNEMVKISGSCIYGKNNDRNNDLENF